MWVVRIGILVCGSVRWSALEYAMCVHASKRCEPMFCVHYIVRNKNAHTHDRQSLCVRVICMFFVVRCLTKSFVFSFDHIHVNLFYILFWLNSVPIRFGTTSRIKINAIPTNTIEWNGICLRFVTANGFVFLFHCWFRGVSNHYYRFGCQ